ncbi:MAG: glycine cleavage system protein GcvH [Gammaproteobacteria bacterium]|nr:glycine cleavage system protein GcvH [Gammaproteobacteria bacterium]NND53405.1 glycine cleavage system protein GcvH [Gammaproteobacteria bacterium]
MSEVPAQLLYTEEHEWLRLEDDGDVTVGITDHAQAALGELVFVEVPESGNDYDTGDACAVVESVKAASDVYCPLAGSITEANEALADEPELVNGSPYDDGWVFRIRPADATVLDGMMDAEAYERFIAELED